MLVLFKKGTSLVVQWLRFCAPPLGGLGLIPGQENTWRGLKAMGGYQLDLYINPKDRWGDSSEHIEPRLARRPRGA